MGFKCPEKPCNIYSFSSPPSFFLHLSTYPAFPLLTCQLLPILANPTFSFCQLCQLLVSYPTHRLILLNPSSSSPRAILVHLSYSSPTLFPAFTSYFCLVYLWFSLFGNNLKLARTVEEITFPQTLESKLST